MRRIEIILVAALALLLAGCVLSGNPKASAPAPPQPQPAAPAPPPEPLSIPQTNVYLPPDQPVNPDALKPAQHVGTPAPAQAATAPAAPPKPGRGNPAPRQTEPETPTAAPPAEPPRQPIQEILSPEQVRQFKRQADSQIADARARLTAARRRGLKNGESAVVANILNFIKQAEEAESKDMRAADEFARKADLLAKELQGGK